MLFKLRNNPPTQYSGGLLSYEKIKDGLSFTYCYGGAFKMSTLELK